MITSAGVAVELHDEQQARVVERLRAANGTPVSFAELRAMGVENPALLCYELAAVGIPVERPREPGSGVRALSVRLEPRSDPEHPDRGAQPELVGGEAGEPLAAGVAFRLADRLGSWSWSRPRVLVGLRGSRALVAVAAASMLLLAVGIGIALSDNGGHGAAGLSADAHASRTSIGRQRARSGKGVAPRSSDRSAAHSAGAQRKPLQVSPQAQRKPVAVSPAAAAAFEADGHQLLGAGRLAAAIGDLRDAIQASGGSLLRCAQPTSAACLTYAYAMYDLGRALQLEGDAAAAIPILSERLRIDNQRETVQRELNIARAARA